MNAQQHRKAAHQLASATLRIALDNGELAEIAGSEFTTDDTASVLAEVGRLAGRHARLGV